jgi:hypothetical protein
MRNNIGIFNSQSYTNEYIRSLRSPSMRSLETLVDGHIRNLEITIKGTVFMRDFHYGCGNLPGARLHAMRLGTLRGQLRQLKAGM